MKPNRSPSMFALDRRVGAAVFKRNFILTRRRKLMQPSVKGVLMNYEQWEISKFQQEGWAEIFQGMHNTEVKGLWVGFNGHCNIIKEISVTLFRNLVELHLYNNNIRSLETLAGIQTRQLYVLNLCWNRIRYVYALARCNFESLAGLYLNNNPIKSLSPLMDCHIPVLDILQLEWYEDQVTQEDISWVSRLSSHSLREIRCESELRLGQSRVCRMLRRKYRQLVVIVNSKRQF